MFYGPYMLYEIAQVLNS